MTPRLRDDPRTDAPKLVLSLFPGADLLGLAFELEGFSVVQGPDVIFGRDIRNFHVPAGRFDGVIGGPPCQAFSTLAALNRHLGNEPKFGNLVPEFERIVREARPDWLVMENVPAAPIPAVAGYSVSAQLVEDRMVGGITERVRRFTFGFKGERGICDCGHPDFQHDGNDCEECSCAYPEYGARFGVETLALAPVEAVRAVTGDARIHTTGHRIRSRKNGGGVLPNTGKTAPLAQMAEQQGLAPAFLEHSPFTTRARRQMLGNGVPLPMGRAVARAVKRALGLELTRVSG